MPRRLLSRDATKVGAAAFSGAIAVAAMGLAAAAGTPDRGDAGSGPAPDRTADRTVEIQLLGVNDFHGHLESPGSIRPEGTTRPVPVGGAAVLAAHLDRAERSHPGHTIRVHDGDMVGASPLISSHFHDEPTVRALNLMHFDVGVLGNHEFDEGGQEMIRLLRGGHRTDAGRFKGDGEGGRVDTSDPDFGGTAYPYLAANTVDREGKLRLPGSIVIERAGVRIGFIGVVTTSTPDYVLTRFAKRFRFLDISDTVNREAERLQHEGVQAIVVMAHEGAVQKGDQARGEIINEAREMTDAVDVVIAGHSHSRLDTRVPDAGDGGGDKLVVQARSFGTAFDQVLMRIDARTGDVVDTSARIVPTRADQVRPDPRVARLVDRYARRVAPIARTVIGRARQPLLKDQGDATRGSIGAVAARAQRRMARADIALVNEGNARASVPAGPITYADLFEASAFEHQVLALRMTGAELRTVLGEQEDTGVQLHVSGADGGRELEPARTYTVAANELLTSRGRFALLRQRAAGAPAVGTDLDALVRYVRARRVVG